MKKYELTLEYFKKLLSEDYSKGSLAIAEYYFEDNIGLGEMNMNLVELRGSWYIADTDSTTLERVEDFIDYLLDINNEIDFMIEWLEDFYDKRLNKGDNIMKLEERLNKIENFAIEKKRKEEEAKLDLLRRETNARMIVENNLELINELCAIVEKIDEMGLLDDNFEDVFFADMMFHKVGFYDLQARNRNGILIYGDYIRSAKIHPSNESKYAIAMLGGGCCYYDILVMDGCLGLYGKEALEKFERYFEKELFELRDNLYNFVDNLGGKN